MLRKKDLILPYFIDNPNPGPFDVWEVIPVSKKRKENYPTVFGSSSLGILSSIVSSKFFSSTNQNLKGKPQVYPSIKC